MSSTILIIDDEIGMCRSLSELLESSGFQCLYSTNPHKALLLLKLHNVALLILDVRMPEIGGIDLLKIVKKTYPDLPVIMITGYPSVENAVTAMRYGALNFFRKPISFEDMEKEIITILSSHKKRNPDNISSAPPALISLNKAMNEIIEIVKKVAATKASVIITGESGTGKELIAAHLHYKSSRDKKPFIKINCAAIPDNLLESELFGHEEGAFTDAKKMHPGKFEMADGGSLFLDEIGDMNLNTQAKILRVLQEQEFQRLGGHQILKTDIRFIAATNKDIPTLITNSCFREDLYYRLSVINIHIPPLRERIEDIPSLAKYFLDSFNSIYDKDIKGLDSAVSSILSFHSWPGNIRELKNCMERSVIFCDGDIIKQEHLPSQYKNLESKFYTHEYGQARAKNDKELILNALMQSNGIKHKAAEVLNMHRKTLYNKMKKLGIE